MLKARDGRTGHPTAVRGEKVAIDKNIVRRDGTASRVRYCPREIDRCCRRKATRGNRRQRRFRRRTAADRRRVRGAAHVVERADTICEINTDRSRHGRRESGPGGHGRHALLDRVVGDRRATRVRSSPRHLDRRVRVGRARRLIRHIRGLGDRRAADGARPRTRSDRVDGPSTEGVAGSRHKPRFRVGEDQTDRDGRAGVDFNVVVHNRVAVLRGSIVGKTQRLVRVERTGGRRRGIWRSGNGRALHWDAGGRPNVVCHVDTNRVVAENQAGNRSRCRRNGQGQSIVDVDIVFDDD